MGTAPGLVVPVDGGPTVVVLPGPPRELHAMWPAAVATEAFRAAVAGAVELRQEMLRLYGIPESEIAETLRLAEDAHGLEGLEITTCLRRGEIEVVTRFSPAAADVYERFVETVRERHADTLFSDDGRTVDQQVADLLRARGLAIATAESCTGGLLAARLTDLAGSSDYVQGGLVVYSNEAKAALASVDPGAHRAGRRGVARGGRGAGRRRAGGAGRRHRCRHHGRGRAGGRDAREAGRARVVQRGRFGRCAPDALDQPARRAGRHPRPLDHRRDAPRAAAVTRGGAGAG